MPYLPIHKFRESDIPIYLKIIDLQYFITK